MTSPRWTIIGTALLAMMPRPAAATPSVTAIDTGAVRIVSADAPARSITDGDAATSFLVLLPDRANCPGDSAHGQWRYQTFMVPTAAEVGSLQYGGIGPTGPDQYALFTADAAQQSWDSQVLPMSGSADAEAPIPALPPFSFAAVSVVPVPEGRYRVGVACTLFGATSRYWDAEIEISGSGLGDPDTFRWSVPGVVEVDSATSGRLRRWADVVLAAALILVPVVVTVRLRRRVRSPHLASPKETR